MSNRQVGDKGSGRCAYQADQGSQRSILSHDIQQTLAQLQAILAPYGISLDDGEA